MAEGTDTDRELRPTIPPYDFSYLRKILASVLANVEQNLRKSEAGDRILWVDFQGATIIDFGSCVDRALLALAKRMILELYSEKEEKRCAKKGEELVPGRSRGTPAR